MSRAIRRAVSTLASFVVAYFIFSLVGHWVNPATPIIPTGERALVPGGTLLMMCLFSAIRVFDSK
jgi:hypothetical protein